MRKMIMILAWGLLPLLAQAQSLRPFELTEVLDNNGRLFYPGDFIRINLSSVQLTEFSMDARGERNATATLYVNGRNMGTKRLGCYRSVYTWSLNYKWADNIVVRFGSVDPRVYSTTVRYNAPVEIRTQIQIQRVEVPVPVQNVYTTARLLSADLEELFTLLGNTQYKEFIRNIYLAVYEADIYSGKSDDSDVSFLVHARLLDAFKLGDSDNAREIWNNIRYEFGNLRNQSRETIDDVVTRIRRSFIHLREMTDYFDTGD